MCVLLWWKKKHNTIVMGLSGENLFFRKSGHMDIRFVASCWCCEGKSEHEGC